MKKTKITSSGEHDIHKAKHRYIQLCNMEILEKRKEVVTWKNTCMINFVYMER